MQVSPDCEEKEVPGNDKWKLFHVVNLVTKGHGYFYGKRDKYKSSVFRINMGVKGIHICDKKGIKVLFDMEKIYKEPAFGRLNYNTVLLDGYTPSMFSNGIPHEKQKTFLLQICEIAQQSKIFETSVKIIKEYSTIWQNADSKLKSTWEQSIMHLTSDIFTEAFFGVRVDPHSMYTCLKGSWGKGRALRKALAGASCLKTSFRESPAITNILKTAHDAGISEEQALMDILFMLNFNSYGGVSGALRTCMARLYVLEPEYKEKMKNEIITVLSHQNLSVEAFKEMPHLNNFILEVLRMHPPVPVFFGRTKDNFILDSESGRFSIKKDELLVANVHMAHRDESIFDQPNKFMPSRFENEALIDHIIFGYGPFNEEPRPKIITVRDRPSPLQSLRL
ncbi:hypothetical protein OS493_005743 [Desmophyllum pertusum]|uniref:sterol 22-desaturase n=1 Tax=Desmophyllum pertusum TaxID=174260 RepID=A0A9W9YIK0_9CNID|nr:hypothetical protein OS493_005743 [Desmophyllum pertusum]